jgi:hypothetical protein
VAEDVQLVLPATAYADVVVGAYRKSRRAVLAVQERVDALEIAITPVTREMAECAAFLLSRRKSGLRLPDAVVLAAADVLRADEVLTARKTFAALHPRARAI